jgi:HD-GYP domain-containing protein (c-di-GMP phosphodiesterase class II)
VVELAELKRLASAQDRAARLRAAASLANAVDARDVYSGNHSQRVAELAVRLAARIGLSREESSSHNLREAFTTSASSLSPRTCCGSRRR